MKSTTKSTRNLAYKAYTDHKDLHGPMYLWKYKEIILLSPSKVLPSEFCYMGEVIPSEVSECGKQSETQ